MRILLLEDDMNMADSMIRAFETRGFEVVHASTVAQAVGAYEPGEFDVLLCDYELPDGTGIEFLSGIHDDFNVTTILWSGLDRTKEAEESGFRHAIDHVLVKSHTLEVLDLIASA